MNREFKTGGIVISLNEVVLGGQGVVLNSLMNDLKTVEEHIDDVIAELEVQRERVETWELNLARATAQRDALKLAIEATGEAFS